MALVIDPAEREVDALRKVMDWRGKHILEIGCGDGRLTLRLASLRPRKIYAIDPEEWLIRTARKQKPNKYADRIRYGVAHAEKLRFPSFTFDAVVFSWAL